MTAAHPHSWIVWRLGVSQLVGYGTLYYSIAILGSHIAGDFGWPTSSIFAALSAGLLAGGLVSPFAGRCLDRHGAPCVMAWGSAAAAATLGLAALAPNGAVFVAAIVAIGLVSPFVQYNAAFTYLGALEGGNARRRIVNLTLIAGFASTLFWPLTTALLDQISWRAIYSLYGAMNLLICLPIHLSLRDKHEPSCAESLRDEALVPLAEGASPANPMLTEAPLPQHLQRKGLVLVALGFAVSGFLYSAVLSLMVPVLNSVGIVGTSAVSIASLFGPAQVLVRLASILAGTGRHPIAATLAACTLLPLSVLVLVAAAPSTLGATAFVVIFGFGSGLTSIVRGTLPLALFGGKDYGARLGKIASIQLVAAAAAPFAFSSLTETAGAPSALLILVATGLAGLGCFVAVADLLRERASGSLKHGT